MMSNRIYRSDDKIFFGVCGGFAEYFEVDPSIFRVLLLILCFLTDTLVVSMIYLLTAMILPSKDDDNDIDNYRLT